MPLVASYKHVQKLDTSSGKYKGYPPLRVGGLALEVAWKACRDKGLFAVQADDVSTVRLGKQLRIREDGRWRSARSCELQVRAAEQSLATTLLRQQRTLFTDLDMNVWVVDVQGLENTLDLRADFSTRRNYGITGRVWVELKLLTEATFEKETSKLAKELPIALGRERLRDPTLEAVLLVATKVEWCFGSWEVRSTVATLFPFSSPEPVLLAGGDRRKARGQAKGQKPSKKKVWEDMQWHQDEDGNTVGLLKHFLKAVIGQQVGKQANAGQRAGTYNAMLREGGCQGQIYETKIRDMPGRDPWVASKSTFNALYSYL